MFLGFKNIIDVEDCPKGTFKNPDTGICDHCMYECDDCESNDRCEDCLDIAEYTNRYLPCGPRCFSIEDAGATEAWVNHANIRNKFWLDTTAGIPEEEKCKPCPWKCTDCESDTDCTYCEFGYVLFEDGSGIGTCLSYDECNETFQYFANTAAGTCDSCGADCEDCYGSATNCVTCQSSAKLYFDFTTTPNEYRCSSTNCPNHYYEDTALEICTICDESCDGCDDGYENNVCLDGDNSDGICATGFYEETVDGTTICTDACCYRQFVDDTLGTTNQCRDCHFSCAACDGTSAEDCTFCPYNRIYHDLKDDKSLASTHIDGECISICPQGMFEFTKYMRENPNYRLPSTPVEYENFIRWQPPEAECIYESDNLDIDIDMVPQFCFPCHSDCTTCFGPGAKDCSSCNSGDGLFLIYNDDGEPNGCSA